MKYCQYCGAMLEDGAQCTCKDAQQAQGFAGEEPSYSQPQQPDYSQQSGYYQQPGGPQQPGYYQQPGDPQQSGYYQQPGGPQQPGYYQQPGGPQQPGYYQQPGYSQQQPMFNQQDAQRRMSDAQKKAKAAANGLWSYLKAYFTAPSEAVQSYLTGERMSVGIILTVVRILSVWLAVYGVLHKICSMASSAMGLAGSLLTGGAGVKISAPLLGSLLYGGLIAVICMGLFILGVFAVVKIQKGDLSLRAAWQASANNSVLPTALLLLSFLVSFVSITFAIVLIGLSIIASLTCGVLTTQCVYTGSKSGMFWLLYFVAVVVIAIITYYVVPMLALKAMGGISVSYMGQTETLGSAIDEMQKAFASSGGLEGLLEEILGSAF